MTTIHFQAVNFKADIKLKEFTKQRLEKLALFHNQISEIFVYTKVENTSDRINKWVELKVGIPGDDVVVKKICKTFEEAIQTASATAERILKRRKEKVRA
jgi:putative sigma-54 modulation protein